MQTNTAISLGRILYFSGIFLGLALAIAAAWTEFEAISYYYTGATYAAFHGLHCPLLMTRSETGMVTGSFDNPGGQEIEPYYEVEISGPLPRNYEDQLSVPPHETKNVQWTVDANDIDRGSFIFVKLDILPMAGYSTREAVCGILVLNVPILKGGQIFWLVLLASLSGMVIGLGLWEGANPPLAGKSLDLKRGMQTLAILVSLAMLTGLMGWWGAGVIFCAAAILLLVLTLRLGIA
jgi:hypothetical protein